MSASASRVSVKGVSIKCATVQECTEPLLSRVWSEGKASGRGEGKSVEV